MRAVCSSLIVMVLGVSVLSVGSTALGGAVSGPGVSTKVLGPRESHSFSVRFESLASAIVTVKGDGDTDLDLYVYDENGHLIASDDDDTDFCMVRWTPRWTGRFTVKVVNRGYLSNRYTIEHN
jgi:hypothetical protein